MKKTFLSLLIAALGVWGYVVIQIIAALLGKPGIPSHASANPSLPALAALARLRPPLDTTFRDPFQSYLYAAKPAPVSSSAPVATRPVLKVIEPPRAVVSGMLWGDPPVAILKQGEQTELVKTGQTVWDLKVVKIERHQVTVVKEGRQFILAY